MDTKIFKSYDIRGIYPNELDEKTAYGIGRAVVEYLDVKNVAIGRDARKSSPALFEALAQGIMDGGADVLDLGLSTTPIVYYASHEKDIDASISLTASHNPPQWNGMKISKKDAVPLGLASGLKDIQALVEKNEWKKTSSKGKIIERQDIQDSYRERMSSFWNLGDTKFEIVVDAANAMGVLELPIYEKASANLSVSRLYCDLSHPFESHEANPLKTETLEELSKKVIQEKADLGIAYDGDADRVGFVDETGTPVPMDIITGILASPVLKKYPNAVILYDLRSSMSVKEEIEKYGGIAQECMVGHANIKLQMKSENAAFGGELSGHYYFRENSYAESGSLASVFLLNRMAETGKKLSELAAEIQKYYHSGEINSTVSDIPAIIKKLKERFKGGTLSELDGVKISFPDADEGTLWWFNVRASNTEPLIRLNIEAKTKEMMEQKRDELLEIIRA